MNIGIIGLGMMGRTHYEAYQTIKGANVTAVSDRRPERAAGDLSGTGGNVLAGGLTRLPMDKIRGTTVAGELIAMNDLQIVDICVPTPEHADVVVEALKAGKNVLCEKPLARNSADAQRIADAAKTAKGMFMPAMCMRFWPQWAWLKSAVAEKRYGKVLSATFRRVAQMPPGWYNDGKTSGGAALDLHIHDTDFVQFLFGMPNAVFSRGYTKASGEIDHLSTQYMYDDVPLVTAEGGWVMSEGFGFSMQYTVNFEKATAVFDLGREQPLTLTQNGKSEPIDCGKSLGYEEELRYFVDCVSKGQKPTIVTAEDGVRSVKIVEAEVQSCKSGEIVRLGK